MSPDDDFDGVETTTYNFNFFTEYSGRKDEESSENFKDLVKRDAEKFAAFCYGAPDINRIRTLELIDRFTKFQNGSAVHNFRNRVLSRLRALGESAENVMKFEDDFEALMNPFENLSSDYRLRKHILKIVEI